MVTHAKQSRNFNGKLRQARSGDRYVRTAGIILITIRQLSPRIKPRQRQKREASSFRGKKSDWQKRHWLKSTYLREIEGLFCHCKVPPFELFAQVLRTGVKRQGFYFWDPMMKYHPKYRPWVFNRNIESTEWLSSRTMQNDNCKKIYHWRLNKGGRV